MFYSKFEKIRHFNLSKPKPKARFNFVPSKREQLNYNVSDDYYHPPPSCLNCKYSIQRDYRGVQMVSLCNLFYVNFINDEDSVYLATVSCRADPNLCGLDGKYFKQK